MEQYIQGSLPEARGQGTSYGRQAVGLTPAAASGPGLPGRTLSGFARLHERFEQPASVLDAANHLLRVPLHQQAPTG